MGAEPEQFSAGAMRLVDAGFDIIDVNFGCPVKKVLGRCRGGFHLSQPEVAIEILQRTRDAVPAHIPVTVKMRRGIDDSQESRDKFFTILDGAIQAGIAAATVHGRTVTQRYVGASRWEFLSDVKSYVGDSIKILGSGDLFCRRRLPADARPNRDRWRHGGARRHRQPMDFFPMPCLDRGASPSPTAEPAPAGRGDARALCALRANLHAGAHAFAHAKILHQVCSKPSGL